jgi:ADP-ribose pyrophosphatase YjhB (NUDIX family)
MTPKVRVAAYAVCIEDDRLLTVRFSHPGGQPYLTLPGGGVDFGEDPVDGVIRELAEETGLRGRVERLLGVDSRVTPPGRRRLGHPGTHHVGVFYEVSVVGGRLRPEPNSETDEPGWVPLADIESQPRAAYLQAALTLARQLPATGHVPPVEVAGLLRD